jgi:hypothetical protein
MSLRCSNFWFACSLVAKASVIENAKAIQNQSSMQRRRNEEKEMRKRRNSHKKKKEKTKRVVVR